ncbi:MAG: bifunctional hydroxymethylpyrimidine kinase/phosphomethylpyrimidine kinase, partial [Planctomycetota bacterium]
MEPPRPTADPRPRVLVLAGHDPSGGAGLDADREACDAAGGGAVLVATAWTEQDGVRVHAVRERDPALVLADALAAAATGVDALKTGLLPSARAIDAVARIAAVARRHARGELRVVVDPVLAASGGEPFLDAAGIRALLEQLVPLGVVLTPNLDELARLADVPRRELDAGIAARAAAAQSLLARGARAVVVKGGHGAESPIVDLLVEPAGVRTFSGPAREPGRRMHGSG